MNTQDQELIEMAAKACGMTVSEALSRIGKPVSLYPQWNPLEDDGDAFRLSVGLKINLQHDDADVWATTLDHDAIEPNTQDAYAATRRAIVRAAAAIGEQLEGNV